VSYDGACSRSGRPSRPAHVPTIRPRPAARAGLVSSCRSTRTSLCKSDYAESNEPRSPAPWRRSCDRRGQRPAPYARILSEQRRPVAYQCRPGRSLQEHGSSPDEDREPHRLGARELRGRTHFASVHTDDASEPKPASPILSQRTSFVHTATIPGGHCRARKVACPEPKGLRTSVKPMQSSACAGEQVTLAPPRPKRSPKTTIRGIGVLLNLKDTFPITGILQMNPETSWTFAVLPHSGKTPWRCRARLACSTATPSWRQRHTRSELHP
jgi:hypothetical protein